MTIHKLDTQMYVGQKAFISKNGKLLVLRDPRYAVDGQSGLDFPGGKYRWTKELHKELEREVREETGLKIKIGSPFVTWTNYNHKDKYTTHAHVYCVGYMCTYVSGNVKLSNEHDMYEWVNKKTYKNWKEKSGYFEALETYFEIKGT